MPRPSGAVTALDNLPASMVSDSDGYLSRDGLPPVELLAVGREEVAGYGWEIVHGTVTSLSRLPSGGFEVVLDDRTTRRARRLLVATGLADELPDTPGLRKRWGRDVIQCPYCFGWEWRDAPLGILGSGPHAWIEALLWRQWSADIILFLHTAPVFTAEQARQLAARGIDATEGEVASVELMDDRLIGIRMRSGQIIPRRALVVGPKFEARHSAP